MPHAETPAIPAGVSVLESFEKLFERDADTVGDFVYGREGYVLAPRFDGCDKRMMEVEVRAALALSPAPLFAKLFYPEA